jgi:hypothetical protein
MRGRAFETQSLVANLSRLGFRGVGRRCNRIAEWRYARLHTHWSPTVRETDLRPEPIRTGRSFRPPALAAPSWSPTIVFMPLWKQTRGLLTNYGPKTAWAIFQPLDSSLGNQALIAMRQRKAASARQGGVINPQVRSVIAQQMVPTDSEKGNAQSKRNQNP